MSAPSKILTLADTHERTQAEVADPHSVLRYEPSTRMYTILWVEPGARPRDAIVIDRNGLDRSDGMVIGNCPWSGGRLPWIIDDHWEYLAVEEYGCEDDRVLDMADRLPPEMLSEEWWLDPNVADWWETRDQRPPSIHEWHQLGEAEKEMPYCTIYEPFVDPSRPGISRTAAWPPHLCWHLGHFFAGPRTMYAYLPQTREYGIRILAMDEIIDHQPVRVKPVPYCPWCGAAHPAPLRAEWESRLAALGLTPDSPDIPADLASDTWWRREGL